MAKTIQTTYNELVTNIRKRHFAPIYLLCGEESYYIDSLADLLYESVVKEDERDFNCTVLYGSDSTIESVINASRQFPLMSELQLVMLKESQTMTDVKTQFEKLDSYVSHPVKTTVLVITFKGDCQKVSKLAKTVLKIGGIVFESNKLKDWQLGQLDGIINEYCKSKHLRIDGKSIAMLKEFIGADLKRLFSEIDKLGIVSGEDKVISPTLIEKNIGISKDYNNFELVKMIANRRYDKSMQIVDYFEHNPKQNPLVVTTSVLFNFFSNLLLSHYSKDKSEQGLMSTLRLKSSMALNDVKSGLANYNARSCISAISSIREFDCKIKGIGVGTSKNEYSYLKELIYKIFTM